jgi:hypothetical protein
MSTPSLSDLPILNFPHYEFRIMEEKGQLKIFDLVRKKYVALTPEEWVRQHLIHYLHKDKDYPLGLMMVEKEFKLHTLTKRADIVVCSRDGNPLLMVECKSANVEITQDVLDQIMRYNLIMNVATVILSNGLKHFCFQLDTPNQTYIALAEIPRWEKQ